MNLRNKKTGEIKDLETIVHEAFKVHEVETIKNIEANWEDYKPKEPLIKDEKIRKAVRAWAEANNFSSKMFFTYYADLHQLSCWQASIEFYSPIDDLEDDKEYCITELCGEEG